MNINSILTSFWGSVKAYLGNNYLGKTAKAESAKSADSVAWSNISGKPDGLDGQILTQNSNEITSENPVQLLNMVNTAEELENALSSTPLTLRDVFDTWYRFAHQNNYVQNNLSRPGTQAALNAWYFDSSRNAIGNTVNTEPYVGFVSEKTYKNWRIKTKGIGTDGDDDFMSIIVAFMTDSAGIEHTLSVVRGGGRDNGWINANDNSYAFALVLDFRNKAHTVLAGIPRSELTGSLWSTGAHIEVTRNGNSIVAKTSQFGSDILDKTFTYSMPTSQGSLSLADYTNIRLMLGSKSRIGFGMYSQPGYFVLEETDGIFDNTDVYDVIHNKVYSYDGGWAEKGTVSGRVLNLSRVYNEKTGKLFYYKDEGAILLGTSGSSVDLSDYVTKAELNAKANDSNVVHKSGNEIINGIKVFSEPTTWFGRDINLMSRLHYGKNSNPSGTTYQYLWFYGNTTNEGYDNAWYSGYIEHSMFSDGSARSRWFIRDTSENPAGVELWASGNDKQFRPVQNNAVELGTSTNKWKTINGVEPSDLSLPSNTSINIDTTGFAWGRNFVFTPSVNGHLFIGINGFAGTIKLSLKVGRGEYYLSNQTGGLLRFTIPVYKGKLVTILVASTVAETTGLGLSLFPCQGNV